MQPPQHADRPTDVGTVDALISEARELRGRMDAMLRETPPPDGDEPQDRWRRALYGLAAHHLRDLGERLGQLREEFAPAPGGAEGPGGPQGAGPGHGPERHGPEQDGPEQDGPHAADGAGAGPRPGAGAGGDGAGGGPALAGSAQWNLVTDEVAWSPELYEIFGHAPEEGPLPLDEVHAWVLPADQKAVATMITGCLVDSRPLDGEFRIVRPDGSLRTVHMEGEPVLDGEGNVVSLWAAVRDVGELRRSERAVRDTRDSLRRARRARRREQRLAARLREAVLPDWPEPLSLPSHGPRSLDVAARRLPRSSGAPVGGTWYDALELPDGSALLSVGGLTGRGFPAASGMAMVLGALRGMAVAGAEPDAVMRGLNHLLDRSGGPALGSVVCCRFDPRSRTLTWAQAGHPAPVLYRGGAAEALRPPEGGPLGAAADAGYGRRSDRLAPGDVLVLRTGGLVPDRGADPAGATRRMLALSPRIAAAGQARECVRIVAEEFTAPDRAEDACVLAARVC